MNKLKVSVITAVRNGLNAVGRTIDSVAEQSYPRIEHVVVDGASSDGTTEYLQTRMPEIDIFQSQPDSGVYDAFNNGLKLATGDIIGYLNAGDVFANRNSVEHIMAYFEDCSVDAVFGDVAMTSQTNLSKVVRRYKSESFTPGRMRYGFMPAHPTLYLRRSVYEILGSYDVSYGIAGDFELALRVFLRRATVFRYAPEILVKMPVGGLSTRGWRSKWRITMEMRTACAKNLVRTNIFLLSLRFPVKTYELIKYRLWPTNE
jgi:glycosyltransferase involved in cell wall biosynthesis